MGCCFDCCSCCDPPDEWTISDEARQGERGAGWLYKQGKSRGNWSKRFFVVTDFSLKYYTDATRTKLKGEIVIIGASVKANDHLNKKKKFHFSIMHPKCGAREFYAISNVRKEEWLNRLTEVIGTIERTGAIYGTLYKQGGLAKSTWQERWCVLGGSTLDYYEDCNDSLPKGSIDVFGGKIREFSAKDKKYCFEIVAKGKKGLKKYSFAVDAQGDRKLWVDQLTKVSKIKQGSATEEGGPTGPGNLNPIHDGDENEPDQERNMPFLRMSSNKIKPDGKEGYLMKKSPSVFKGWQKRYFVIHDPGEMDYYETMEEYKKSSPENGKIQLAEINSTQGVEIVRDREILVRVGKRTYELQAASKEEAQSWAKLIEEWSIYLTSSD